MGVEELCELMGFTSKQDSSKPDSNGVNHHNDSDNLTEADCNGISCYDYLNGLNDLCAVVAECETGEDSSDFNGSSVVVHGIEIGDDSNDSTSSCVVEDGIRIGVDSEDGTGIGVDSEDGTGTGVESEDGIGIGVESEDVTGIGVDSEDGTRTGVESEDEIGTGVQSEDGIRTGVESEDGIRTGVESEDGIGIGVESEDGTGTVVDSEDGTGTGVESEDEIVTGVQSEDGIGIGTGVDSEDGTGIGVDSNCAGKVEEIDEFPPLVKGDRIKIESSSYKTKSWVAVVKIPPKPLPVKVKPALRNYLDEKLGTVNGAVNVRVAEGPSTPLFPRKPMPMNVKPALPNHLDARTEKLGAVNVSVAKGPPTPVVPRNPLPTKVKHVAEGPSKPSIEVCKGKITADRIVVNGDDSMNVEAATKLFNFLVSVPIRYDGSLEEQVRLAKLQRDEKANDLHAILLQVQEKTVNSRVHKENSKRYDDAIKQINQLQALYRAANDVHQVAYAKWQSLSEKLYEKSKHCFDCIEDKAFARKYASARNTKGLSRVCMDNVESFMKLWNKDDEFRREYVRFNGRSTITRLETLDGRSLGPDEVPPVLPDHVDVTAKQETTIENRISESEKNYAELKEQYRLDELAKANKVREKRLRKKERNRERKKAAASAAPIDMNDVGTSDSSLVIISDEIQVEDNSSVAPEKPQKSSLLINPSKAESVPPTFGNRNKKKMLQLTWAVIVIVVILLVLWLVNGGEFPNLNINKW
ncbi:hypothetical protein ABFS82_03G002400 [Erythranthe guttata]